MKFQIDAPSFYQGLKQAIAATMGSYEQFRKDAVLEAFEDHILIRTDNRAIKYEHRVKAEVSELGLASIDLEGPARAINGLTGNVDVELEGPRMTLRKDEFNFEVSFPVRLVSYDLEMPVAPDHVKWSRATGIRRILYVVERSTSDSFGVWVKGRSALAISGVNFAMFNGTDILCKEYTLIPFAVLNYMRGASIAMDGDRIWVKAPSYTAFSTPYEKPPPADMLWDFLESFTHDQASTGVTLDKKQVMSLAPPMRYIGRTAESGGKAIFAIRKNDGKAKFYLPASLAGKASFEVVDHGDGEDFVAYVGEDIFSAIANSDGPMVDISLVDERSVLVSSPGDTVIHSVGVYTEHGFEASREALNVKAQEENYAASIPI